MDDELAIILFDEIHRVGSGGDEPSEAPRRQTIQTDQTVVVQRTNFTTGNNFVIGDQTRAFPFFGPGRLESLLIIAEDDTFTINVDLDTPSDFVGQDETTFISEDFPTLKEISTELSSIAAYENNEGNHVVDIGPIDYLEEIRAWVEPSAPITIQRIRAELTLERFVDDGS